MSYNPYSPWSGDVSSSSSTASQVKSDGGWWRNTKDVFKKPWKRKGEKKAPFYVPTTQQDHWNSRPFGGFPPLMSQLSPGVFQHERRSSNPEDRLSKQLSRVTTGEQQTPNEDFDLPEYEGQRRPRLDNIFPIYDAPSVSAAAAGARKSTSPSLKVGNRLGGSGAVGRSSSFNETDVGVRRKEKVEPSTEQGRDETDGGDKTEHTRKESMESTGSEDRTLERRKRRLGAVRQLPKLPPRTGFEWNEVRSLPEVNHHRRRRPTPVPTPFERREVDVFQPHHPQFMNPSRGVPMHNFSYPHWDSPAESLPTLAEESDSGEIKGFDNFILY